MKQTNGMIENEVFVTYEDTRLVSKLSIHWVDWYLNYLQPKHVKELKMVLLIFLLGFISTHSYFLFPH